MPNLPLCALVHDDTTIDPRALAGSARACLADIRRVLVRHGFHRAASGVQLAALAVDDDLHDITVRRLEGLDAAE